MAETIPCKRMFSNGTEYEWFLENQCFRCTRFRNWHCRIVNRCEMARFDEAYFPYDDLLDYKGFGGKECKHFTTEKPKKKWNRHQVDGQMEMVVNSDG